MFTCYSEALGVINVIDTSHDHIASFVLRIIERGEATENERYTMAMSTRSAKAKGMRFQNEIRDKITEAFTLEEGDVTTTTAGVNGVDIKLSPAARRVFPFSIECKNTERLNLWDAIEQSEENIIAGTFPMVAFKRNRSKAYCVIEFDTLLNIIKGRAGE